jgi:hypothetical protein
MVAFQCLQAFDSARAKYYLPFEGQIGEEVDLIPKEKLRASYGARPVPVFGSVLY